MAGIGMFRSASALLARAKYAIGGGFTFDAKRDLYSALGYKRVLGPEDFWNRYQRNAIAKRIVETYPKATWRGGGELIEDDTISEMTPFEKAWDELATRLRIWPTLQSADILAGLGEYGVLLIGGPGALDTPLPRSLGPDSIAYLQPLGQNAAQISTFEQDPSNPRFGQPVFYNLAVKGNVLLTSSKRVHYSRVLHLAEGALDNPVYGDPRLQAVWNLLDDLEKVTGGGAEAFWLRAHPGYHIDVDPEIELDEDGKRELREQMDEFVHNMRRTLRTRGSKVTTFDPEVAIFDKNVDAILVQISGGTGIPHRILTGSERGELASTQDKNNWNERVQDRRRSYAGPYMLRPLVDLFISLGVLPKPAKYDIRWPEVRDSSDMERAELSVKMAETNLKAGQLVLHPDEIRDIVWARPPLTDEQKADDPSEKDRKLQEETAKAGLELKKSQQDNQASARRPSRSE